jgi:hypothetical protein
MGLVLGVSQLPGPLCALAARAPQGLPSDTSSEDGGSRCGCRPHIRCRGTQVDGRVPLLAGAVEQVCGQPLSLQWCQLSALLPRHAYDVTRTAAGHGLLSACLQVLQLGNATGGL